MFAVMQHPRGGCIRSVCGAFVRGSAHSMSAEIFDLAVASEIFRPSKLHHPHSRFPRSRHRRAANAQCSPAKGAKAKPFYAEQSTSVARVKSAIRE